LVVAGPKLGLEVIIAEVALPVGSAVYAQLSVTIAVVGAEMRGRVMDPSQTHSALFWPWSGSAYFMEQEGFGTDVVAAGVVAAGVIAVETPLTEIVTGVIDVDGSSYVDGRSLSVSVGEYEDWFNKDEGVVNLQVIVEELAVKERRAC
jgi:hypothetical protein